MDKGLKYSIMSLKDKEVTILDLSKHDTGNEAAERLNQMLIKGDLTSLNLDINDRKRGIFSSLRGNKNYVSVRSHLGINKIYVTFHTNKIDINVAQFLNKTFQKITIAKVILDKKQLGRDLNNNLMKAFKDINISELKLSRDHINETDTTYLVEAFKRSQIATLNLDGEKIGNTGAKNLCNFLKNINVLHINLCQNDIGAEGIKSLSKEISKNKIMYIDLSWNKLGDKGVLHLSDKLANSKIIDLNLCHNNIGAQGAKHLARGMRFSQVTRIYLHGNDIGYAGYKYLIDVVKDKNVSPDNTQINRADEREIEWLYTLRKDTIDTVNKIRHTFQELVSLNSETNEYEFIVPGDNANINIEQYGFLINSLNRNEDCKVHIFDMLCNTDPFDFNKMKKINTFIPIMLKKFNKFINDHLQSMKEL